MSIVSRHVSAPRGATITCKGWPQEAALRMLMNNLDPEVAERPDDLVVYGGSGTRRAQLGGLRRHRRHSAARSSTTRRSSCNRASRSPSFARIPGRRASSSPTPCSCRPGRPGTRFRDLEDRGLTMYGQMTAGSWIYIGTQGILQGTYETLAEVARRHFDGTLAGRLVVTAGLGGMGGAQPLAVTMNGGVALVVEVDPAESSGGWRRNTSTSAPATSTRRWTASSAGWRSHRAFDRLEGTPPMFSPNSPERGIGTRRRHRSDVGARLAQRVCAERHVAARGRESAARKPQGVYRTGYRRDGRARSRDAQVSA